MSGMLLLITCVAFLVLIFLQVPIAVSLGISSFFYIWQVGTLSFDQCVTTMVRAADSFPLLAIPLFILVGGVIEGGGLGRRLVNFVGAFVDNLTGGYAMVTVLTCAVFGAISGSAVATVAAIGSIMVPIMLEKGYSKNFSYGLICAAGCLGCIIPPSVPMIMYSASTGASVAALFMGGFGPGILIAIVLCILCYILSKKYGYHGSGIKFSWKRVGHEFKEAGWTLMIPVIIIGGIYGGIFTPTEAAAVAVVYSLFVGIFIYKEFKWENFVNSFKSSCITVGTIMIVVILASLFGRVLTLAQLPAILQAFMESTITHPWVFLLVLNLVLLFVGCFMDVTAAILILAPILYPLAVSFDVHPVHLGLIMVINLAIGLCTPPVGGNLYVACSIGNMKFASVAKAVIPFLCAMLVSLLIITFIPQITLLLPDIMGLLG